MTAIDLTDKLDPILGRYPEYWCSEDAEREFRALWGNPGADICNDCGVFTNEETIGFRMDGDKQWYAEVHIARAPNGWHAISTSYWYGQGGGGYAPSVHTRTAYLTRESALEAGIKE